MPGAIRSHLLPSFYLAQHLANDYDIYYLINGTDHEKLITDQGYHFVGLKTRDIGNYCEYHHVKRKFGRYGSLIKWCIMIKLFLANELYRKRKEELTAIVDQLQPDIVLIDVFSITNYLFFYASNPRVAIAFFSPMLSTHYTPGFPLINESNWNNTQQPESFYYTPAKSWSDKLYKALDNWQIRRCCRSSAIPSLHRLSRKNLVTTYFFENVPELVLAPAELEFSPGIPRPGQHYLGLCTSTRRNETGADTRFNIHYFQQYKQAGRKIIYCSFGTYFHTFRQHAAVCSFVTRVAEAFREQSDIEVIIAVNDRLQIILQDTMLPQPHIHIFSIVPQLKVLELADVFITHGGLGSVKESIGAAVPMLVYPLDFRWDQPGNALKVEYHGLGLRGDMTAEPVEEMRRKVDTLAGNPVFRQRLLQFRNSIREADWIQDVLSQAV